MVVTEEVQKKRGGGLLLCFKEQPKGKKNNTKARKMLWVTREPVLCKSLHFDCSKKLEWHFLPRIAQWRSFCCCLFFLVPFYLRLPILVARHAVQLSRPFAGKHHADKNVWCSLKFVQLFFFFFLLPLFTDFIVAGRGMELLIVFRCHSRCALSVKCNWSSELGSIVKPQYRAATSESGSRHELQSVLSMLAWSFTVWQLVVNRIAGDLWYAHPSLFLCILCVF